ncbi:MAG: glycosyltransferase family 39 protein [bacterium]|nr:glycosyltransferase family 39 protein [bacterium]
MKTLRWSLTVVSIFFIATGVVFFVLKIDEAALRRMLVHIGLSGTSALTGFNAPAPGFLISGAVILLIVIFFQFCENSPRSIYKWNDTRFMIFALSLKFIIGILYISAMPYVFDAQDRWFYEQAKQLAAGLDPIWNHSDISLDGAPPTAYWPIGYSMFLAPFFKVFGASAWLAQILNVLLLMGVTFVTFLLTKDLFNINVAKRATMLVVFVPSLTFYALPVLSDPLFALMVMLIVYIGQKKITVAKSLILGGLLGFSILTRPILILFPIVLALFQFYRNRQLKSALLQFVIVLIVGAVVTLPWQIRNYRAFGQFVFVCTQGGWNLWMGNNPHTTGREISFDYIPQEASLFSLKSGQNEADVDKTLTRMAIHWAVTHPLEASINYPKKVFFMYYRDSKCVFWSTFMSVQSIPPTLLTSMYLLADGFYFALGISFLIALVDLIRRRNINLNISLLLSVILYITICYIPFVGEDRYHLPLMPIFAIIAVLNSHSLQSKSPSEPINLVN